MLEAKNMTLFLWNWGCFLTGFLPQKKMNLLVETKKTSDTQNISPKRNSFQTQFFFQFHLFHFGFFHHPPSPPSNHWPRPRPSRPARSRGRRSSRSVARSTGGWSSGPSKRPAAAPWAAPWSRAVGFIDGFFSPLGLGKMEKMNV